jgi:hypothetical protein
VSPTTYREILRALVRTLLDETAGEPRVNTDAALHLIAAHRRLDTDYAWAAVEAECSARGGHFVGQQRPVGAG